MAGIQFIELQGRRVLLLDFTATEPAEALQLIAQSRALVAAQPRRKELLVAVDVKRMTTNDEVLESFQELARHNAPWVLASAICNPSRLGKVITRARRDHRPLLRDLRRPAEGAGLARLARRERCRGAEARAAGALIRAATTSSNGALRAAAALLGNSRGTR